MVWFSDQTTRGDRMAVSRIPLTELPPAAEYLPESDGTPIAETDVHRVIVITDTL
jgi:hypothetical protein